MKRFTGVLASAVAVCIIGSTAAAISATAYEAENAEIAGSGEIVSVEKAYGGKVVDGLKAKDSVSFKVEAATEDTYVVRVYYRNPDALNSGFDIRIDNVLYEMGNGSSLRGSRWVYVTLTKGSHTITVIPQSGRPCPQIDQLLIEYKSDYGMGGDAGTAVPEVGTADDCTLLFMVKGSIARTCIR